MGLSGTVAAISPSDAFGGREFVMVVASSISCEHGSFERGKTLPLESMPHRRRRSLGRITPPTSGWKAPRQPQAAVHRSLRALKSGKSTTWMVPTPAVARSQRAVCGKPPKVNK